MYVPNNGQKCHLVCIAITGTSNKIWRKNIACGVVSTSECPKRIQVEP